MRCETCGRDMKLVDKDTSSGRDMRTYECPICNKSVDIDNGIATWKALSDEKDKSEDKRP